MENIEKIYFYRMSKFFPTQIDYITFEHIQMLGADDIIKPKKLKKRTELEQYDYFIQYHALRILALFNEDLEKELEKCESDIDKFVTRIYLLNFFEDQISVIIKDYEKKYKYMSNIHNLYKRGTKKDIYLNKIKYGIVNLMFTLVRVCINKADESYDYEIEEYDEDGINQKLSEFNKSSRLWDDGKIEQLFEEDTWTIWNL